MPRSKKAVLLERPEELLRLYRVNCPCQAGHILCEICKAQPEAVEQLEKMRKAIVVYETRKKEEESKQMKRPKNPFSSAGFEPKALKEAKYDKMKQELNSSYYNIMLDKLY